MPLSREQTDAINSLVRAKHIEAARHLLTEWNATESLAKLNAKHPPKIVKRDTSPIPHEPDAPTPPLWQQIRVPVLIGMVIVLSVMVVLMQQQWQRDYDATMAMFSR